MERLDHCTDGEEPFRIRRHCYIVEGHILEFVFTQELDFREIARKALGEYVTYGSVDILRNESSEIERGRYYRDQRTRRTILSSSTDRNADYRNPTRQSAFRNLYRSAHLPPEAAM